MTALADIDLDQLVADVRAFAELAPDFTYRAWNGSTACQYFPDRLNPCGCIIGAALAEQDVDVTTLPAHPIRRLLADWGGDLVEHTAVDRLTAVQHHQDIERTWSEAVEKADFEALGVARHV